MNPGPQDLFSLAISLSKYLEDVPNDRHVLLAEPTRRTIPKHVALRGMVIHRVGSAIGLEGTVRTASQRFIAGRSRDGLHALAEKYLLIRIIEHVAQPKARIVHLR